MFKKIQNIFSQNWFVFSIFFIIGITLYFKIILYAPFIFDDNLSVELNQVIKQIFPLDRFFTSSLEYGSNFYRPIQTLSSAILYKMFGLNTHAFHALPIFVHILNAFLVFILLKKLSFSRIISFFGALLFLVHPVQIEAVSYVTGFSDPLSFFFMISAILIFLYNYNSKKIIINFSIIMLYILALLSRETAVMFPGLIFILGVYLEKSKIFKKSQFINLMILMATTTLVYLYIKFHIFNFMNIAPEKNIYTTNLYVRIITFIANLWQYFILIIYPKHLYLEKPYIAYIKFFDIHVLKGFLLLLIAIITSFSSKKQWLGIAWFFIAMVPVMGIIPINALYLEHWLYMSIIGIIISILLFFSSIKNLFIKKILALCFILFLIIISIKTFSRNNDWIDPIRFYINEIKYSPNNARIHNNLAMYYADAGDTKKAFEYYKKAVSINDKYPQTHHNLGNLYLNDKQYDMAYFEYVKAILIDHNFIYSYLQLAELYRQFNKQDKYNAITVLLNKYQNNHQITDDDIKSILL